MQHQTSRNILLPCASEQVIPDLECRDFGVALVEAVSGQRVRLACIIMHPPVILHYCCDPTLMLGAVLFRRRIRLVL